MIDNNASEQIEDEPFRQQDIEGIEEINRSAKQIRDEISKFIVGQQEVINFLLVSILVKGHVLIEGVPGIAKTYLARIFSKTISSDFSRIQFTPDLMPSDITGTSIFNLKTSEFNYKKGPVFSNLVLIDEINRAPAKTQASLFEVMQERQITFDGITYKIEEPFMVLATQNPIEQEGTYKLPEAQLDRFMFRIKMNYPSLEEEILILDKFKSDFDQSILNDIKPCLDKTQIRDFQATIEKINIKEELLRYIAQIIVETRGHGSLYLGASTRASLSVLKGSKAMAAIQGRDYVIPEDIHAMAGPVLNHRILLNPERELEGVMPQDIINEILTSLEIPR